MKTKILFGATTLLAASLIAAESGPTTARTNAAASPRITISAPDSSATITMTESGAKGDVAKAAKKLGSQTNYTWRTTVAVPEDAPFKPGPTDGKTEKGGFTHVTMSFFDNPVQIVVKGTKAAFTDQEGAWQLASDAEGEEGPGRFMAMFVRNLQTPADEAAELAGFAKELKKDGEVYSGDLTEPGAKAKLSFRGSDATVTNPKGSVKFWVKDGVLTKYEYQVKGTVNWGGNDFENDRTTTVEIKDVGTTKVEVPEAAKKKLS